MGKATNSSIDEKYGYIIEKINYYDSADLNYYMSDVFNQPDNLPDVYYV